MEPETAEQTLESIRRWARGDSDLSPPAVEVIQPLGDTIRIAAHAAKLGTLREVGAVVAVLPIDQREALRAACRAADWCDSHLSALLGPEPS